MSSRMTLMGLCLTFAWSSAACTQPVAVPPGAPRHESPPAAPRANTGDSTQSIVLLSDQVDDSSKPGTPEVRSLHFSTDPATGESKVFTKLVPQSYKRICFRVAPSVQGQIGTIVRQLPPASTARTAGPDSLVSRSGLRSMYANWIRTRYSGKAPATDAGLRFVATEYQVSAGESACVELSSGSGRVEVFWLVYGSPNPEARKDLPVKGADGVMQFRLVQYHPLFLGTEPDQIESSAKVIHAAVVDLDRGVVIEDRELWPDD
jgi:hypothetical protein